MKTTERMIQKSLEDVTEILKKVFGEGIDIDININKVSPEKMLESYGMEAISGIKTVWHGRHNMTIYSNDYLPFESKPKTHFGGGIVE